MRASRHHHEASLVVSFAAMLFVAAPRRAAADADPIDWPPPSAVPAFRERLAGDDYHRQFDAALKDLGEIAKESLSQHPDHCFRVTEIESAGKADELGIQVGDFLLKIDGEELWWEGPRPDRKPRQLEFFSRAVESVRKVRFPAGPLGLRATSYWRPSLQFLRGPQRDPRWEKEVLVATSQHASNPDLAETAWYHAMRAGYQPDFLSAASGAVISLAQHRAEEAADFIRSGLAAEGEERRYIFPFLLYRVAVANYKWNTVLEIVRRDPQSFPDYAAALEPLVELHRGRSAAQRSVAPPSRRAPSMYRDALLPRCAGLDENSRTLFVPRLLEQPRLEFQVPTDHFQLTMFGPLEPVRDVDLTVRFKARPTAEGRGDFAKCVIVRLLRREPELETDGEADIHSAILGVEFRPGPTVFCRFGEEGRLVYGDDALVLDGVKEHEVRIIRIGGQAELFIDGGRVLYLPVDADDGHVGFLLQAIGMTGEFTSVEACELIEKP